MQIIEITSNTITRPADVDIYASGDLIANSVTNTAVTPFTFTVPFDRGILLYRLGLLRSDVAVTNATFRFHLYKDSPTVTNGDNGAWLSPVAGYQGYVDLVGTAPAFSDDGIAWGIYINTALQIPMPIVVSSDRILYGLLEARAAYTPTSGGTFTAILIGSSYV